MAETFGKVFRALLLKVIRDGGSIKETRSLDGINNDFVTGDGSTRERSRLMKWLLYDLVIRILVIRVLYYFGFFA